MKPERSSELKPSSPELEAQPLIRAPRALRALHLADDLELELTERAPAAKWALAGLLVPIGFGLAVTGGVIYVVLHFIAKWW